MKVYILPRFLSCYILLKDKIVSERCSMKYPYVAFSVMKWKHNCSMGSEDSQ